MMKYFGPDGQTELEPSEDFIKDVLKKSAQHWLSGSGDSSLQDGFQSLIFFKDEDYGVFIMQSPDFLSPYKSDISVEKIYHSIGGEPMPVPTCCYLSTEEAEKILLDYIKNYTVSGIEKWKYIYDIISEDEEENV